MPYAGTRMTVRQLVDLTTAITTASADLDSKAVTANIVRSQVSITPVASTPTSQAVTGLTTGGSTFYALVSAETTVPNTVLEVGATGVSGTGITLWVYRTNTTATLVTYIHVGV